MNESKVQILKCLSDGDWWTTSEVAEACGLTLTDVSELLRRYRGQGLVIRERNYDVPRGYLYRITGVGAERLEYLTSGLLAVTSTIASNIGLYGEKKRVLDNWVKQRLGR
jgi:DNA-binding MarR family transcriptional regulator